MADEPNEQPPAEGDDAAAPEEVSPPAPEAQADQESNESDAQVDQPAAEEPAPAEATEEPAPVEATAAPDEPAAEEPTPDEPVAEEPAAEEPAPAEAAAEEPAAAEAAEEEPRRQRPPRSDGDDQPREETVVPGAHLEPDLVLDESRPAEAEFDPYATASDDAPIAEGEEAATVEDSAEPASAPRTPLELAADARYRATGKRKRAIARVILKPGAGTYTINGKELDVYFPRVTLQKNARLPLQTTGNDSRMDVVAKIHGGGVSSQAIALRHGISRALVEADPSLRTELKRHGFLTRDARVKERKKAGLKKARKRPQFSKR
jgi:small subunit ribosomal protein S9